MNPSYYLVLSAALFTLGAVGVLVRRCGAHPVQSPTLGATATRPSPRGWAVGASGELPV